MKGPYSTEVVHADVAVLINGCPDLAAAHGQHLAATGPRSTSLEAHYVFPQEQDQKILQEFFASQQGLTTHHK